MAEEFNGWNQNADPMEKDGNGNWTKTKMLSPGEVEYKFWVNGQWVTYPKNLKICKNCYGTINNIATIAAR